MSIHGPHDNLDGLFKPVWSTLETGQRISVVLDKMIWHGNVALGKIIPGEQVVRISGLVPPCALTSAKVTVIGATFLSVGSVVDLELDDRSQVLCHLPLSMGHLSNLVEVCAGVGLSSVGFQKVGFRHRCAVEKQPKLAALHQLLHPGVPVICADLTEDHVASQVFHQCPEPAAVMAGISCQPFSRGGSQMGEHDSRASSLPATLRFVHLVQAPVLFLECVVPARSNQYVQSHVQALTQQLGFHVVDCTMKLEDVWTAFRYRWWLLATHPCMGAVKIPPFPKGGVPWWCVT